MNYKSDFLNEINSRGFIYQTSDVNDLDDILSKKKITAYIGFDITNDSLHIGSLVKEKAKKAKEGDKEALNFLKSNQKVIKAYNDLKK